MQTTKIAELQAEIARLKYREQHCSTVNQALFVSAVRFLQEAAAVVGLDMTASPATILAEIKQRAGASTQVPATAPITPASTPQGGTEPTYLPWTVGQLHPAQRERGCENLYAIFSESKLTPNVKMTVAENLTEADANLVVEAVNARGYGSLAAVIPWNVMLTTSSTQGMAVTEAKSARNVSEPDPPDRRGMPCLDCEEETLPVVLLQLGQLRCVRCQTIAEQRDPTSLPWIRAYLEA